MKSASQPKQEPDKQKDKDPKKNKEKEEPPADSYNLAGKLEQIEKMKLVMKNQQQKYFQQLQEGIDPINVKLGERSGTRIEEKIGNNLSKGLLQIKSAEQVKTKIVEDQVMHRHMVTAEKEKEMLSAKLKSIDFELHTLKNQKIENPFSVYSQPNLKVYVQEENLLKQKQAEDFVQKLNEKQKEQRKDLKKKLKEQLQKHKEEEQLQKQLEDNLQLEERKDKQEKLKQHIQELKRKHENRLEEMEKFEESYFTELNKKLKKLKEERKHISNLDYDVEYIEPFRPGQKQQKKPRTAKSKSRSRSPQRQQQKQIKGVASKDNNKNNASKPLAPKTPSKTEVSKSNQIEFEKPLFERIRDDFNQKMKNEDDLILKERKKKREFDQKYTTLDPQHSDKYIISKKKLKKKYEDQRASSLEKLGLKGGKITQNVNASFDSKLWVLSANDVTQSAHTESFKKHIEEAKERNLKIKSYIEKIRSDLPVHEDEEKKHRLEIAKDKLLNPRKYIKKPKEMREKKKDEECFEKSLPAVDEIDKKQMGVAYLRQLPENISKAREEWKLKESEKELLKPKPKRRLIDDDMLTKSVKVMKKETFGTGERPDYLKQIKMKYHLDDKYELKEDWRAILENAQREEKPLKLPKIQRPATQKEPEDSEKLTFQEKAQLHRKEHLKKVRAKQREIKESQNQKEQLDDLQKIQQAANILNAKAQDMEKVIKSQWNTKPLKSVEQAAQVDDLYLESIKAKLKVLELQSNGGIKKNKPKEEVGQA